MFKNALPPSPAILASSVTKRLCKRLTYRLGKDILAIGVTFDLGAMPTRKTLRTTQIYFVQLNVLNHPITPITAQASEINPYPIATQGSNVVIKQIPQEWNRSCIARTARWVPATVVIVCLDDDVDCVIYHHIQVRDVSHVPTPSKVCFDS